jgi:hypothetical protein
MKKRIVVGFLLLTLVLSTAFSIYSPSKANAAPAGNPDNGNSTFTFQDRGTIQANITGYGNVTFVDQNPFDNNTNYVPQGSTFCDPKANAHEFGVNLGGNPNYGAANVPGVIYVGSQTANAPCTVLTLGDGSPNKVGSSDQNANAITITNSIDSNTGQPAAESLYQWDGNNITTLSGQNSGGSPTNPKNPGVETYTPANGANGLYIEQTDHNDTNSACHAYRAIVLENSSSNVGTEYEFSSDSGSGGKSVSNYPQISSDFDSGCNVYGTSTVYITGAQGSTPVGGAGGGSGDGSSAPSLSCHTSFNPITWLVCPAVSGMVSIVNQLDNLITGQLDVGNGSCSAQQDNPCEIFGNTTQTSKAYYSAWSSFRDIALGLLAVATLIVVIAEAVGTEIIDAYTVRKVLPRVLIAAIAMTLSWQLMQFFVTLTNDLGFGIRYLIYQPFLKAGITTATLSGGGATAVGLVGAEAIVALGIFGLLSFAASAAIAVFLAFLVLILRQMVIIILIILSPIAIVAYILPNTQNVFKVWWESFSKALLMFPIIAAFIAAGRVFSAIATSSGSGGAVGQLMGFAAYFLPYLILPFTFRFAGAALGGLGGAINDRGQALHKPLRDRRAAKRSENYAAMKSGTRFQDNNALARGFNTTTRRAGLGYKGRYGFGARGRGASDLALRAGSKEVQKSNPLMQELGYDDNAVAVMALSGGTRAGAQRAAARLGLNDEDTRRAVGTAAAIGFNNVNTAAAIELMGNNKSRVFTAENGLNGPDGLELVRQSAASITNNSAQGTDNIMGNYQFLSRGAGRNDLGGNDLAQSWSRVTVGQHMQAFTPSTRAFADSFANTMQSNTATQEQKMAAAIAFSEMQNNKSGATADNQTVINEALNRIGVDYNAVDTDPATGRTRPVGIEEQLSRLVNAGSPAGTAPVTANDIIGRARTWNSPVGEREVPGATTGGAATGAGT